jgi:hypothetical protein
MVAAFVALLPLLLGLLVVAATVLGWIFYRKRRARRLGLKFPISEPLLRPAGYGLGQKMDDAWTDMIVALVCGMYSFTSILALHAAQTAYFHVPESPLRWIISGVGVAVILAYCIQSFLKSAKKLRDLRLGWIGELATAESLTGLIAQGYRVFHDVPADGFNIDHVAIGPHGVFAIETKFRLRRVKANNESHKVTFDGRQLTFPAGGATDKPLAQAKRQAQWLSEWLGKATGQPVKAIPCVSLPGWYINWVGQGDVVVVTPKAIESSLTRRPRDLCLDSARLQQIAYQIDRRCRTLDHRDRIL